MYLPVKFPTADALPLPYGRDLLTQVGMIEAMYTQQYPPINYRTLLKSLAHRNITTDAPVGAVNTTVFDALWGEPVDPLLTGVAWKQAHLSGYLDATANARYADSKSFPARTQVEATDVELKRWGFDRVRSLIVTIPVSFLDHHEITIAEGDLLEWNGQMYAVKDIAKVGRWFNTETFLYRVLNLDQARRGS